MELVPEKTKLLVWSPSSRSSDTRLLKLSCPIIIDDKIIKYSTSAEHVGIRRAVDGGNMPHILDRIGAHTRALASVLHTGAAKQHSANPSSALQLDRIYGSGVLFSGTASLVLNKKETDALSRHYRHTLCRLQKLPLNTPECVVFFLGGSLPATAILHLRILSLFGMISRSDPNSILQQIGRRVYLSKNFNRKSWFSQIKLITQLYLLPDPLLLLQTPSSKVEWKKLCKAKVVSYWEEKLRADILKLPSLKYFSPQFMSLQEPHPLWTCAESGYEVKKAVVVANMISGRYCSDYHVRHWSRTNPEGLCQLCLASAHSSDLPLNDAAVTPLGTLEHLLLECEYLESTRDECSKIWVKYVSENPSISDIIPIMNGSVRPTLQFLLDPTTCPNVISTVQSHGRGILCHLLYLCRLWCYSLHLRRQKSLKLLNII